MQLAEMQQRMDEGGRARHLIGSEEAGVLAALDMEGRLFAVLHGEVLNRVNADTILRKQPAGGGYANPGGDGLWPAPEGTTLGYEYVTGTWRVPPSLTQARFEVIAASPTTATIRAELDLINAKGIGVPTAFERRIAMEAGPNKLLVTTTECIEYLGQRTLDTADCLLAPWSLCQFDCDAGCEVVFPEVPESEIWDLYDPSTAKRQRRDGLWHTATDGTFRYQIGLGAAVEWIEFVHPARGLRVRRSAKPLPPGMRYIDIADRPPNQQPDPRGVRFSVYSDAGGFMEIEAAGGCPATLEPGARMAVTVRTEFRTSHFPRQRTNSASS